MVTRDTVFPVRIKFLFILDFVILSAFSLITDDGKINVEVPTTQSHSKTRIKMGTIPTANDSVLTAENSVGTQKTVNSYLAKSEQKSTSMRDKTFVTSNNTRFKTKYILFSNKTLLPLPMGDANWSISENTAKKKDARAKEEEKFMVLMSFEPISGYRNLLKSANNNEKFPTKTENIKIPLNSTLLARQQKIIKNEHNAVNSLKNISEQVTGVNISNRHGKEFISEEALMESRNYNYNPAHSTYNQPVEGNPTASDDPYYSQTFATITRDLWPNYQQQDFDTYPTITTVKTPRTHAHPHYLNHWRLPLIGYRQRAKLRQTYHKDDVIPYYDYLDDLEDSSPLKSVGVHRWSQASTDSGAGSSVDQIRPEFHRYHENGGYEYNPHYDFAHVHEHSGNSETQDSGYKLDLSKIGLLLLLKLVIAKLKALGALQILLLLLLKAKMLLAMMALKFFMVMKALKLAKYLLAPLLLYSLLPLLLLGPLSLLPALLPLLMNLNPPPDEEEPPDIPDIPDPDMSDDTRMRKKKFHRSRELDRIQRVLRSEECLQRIACELAAKRQMPLVPLIVNWSLKRLAEMLPLPTVKSYAEAYTVGRQRDKTSTWCSMKYRCNHLKKRS